MTNMTNAKHDLTAESNRLAERIWAVFPVTQPAFAKLLGLLEVEASQDIPTACVTFGVRSRLLINPDFAAQHCGSDRALVMLVLHELYHIVLGHTRLWARITPAQNWAFDAVINAQLCLLFPEPADTGFFRHLYSAEKFPEALLRPPEGWGSDKVTWLEGPLGAAHKALYTDVSLSYEALFDLLSRNAEEAGLGGDALEDGRLLGNHDGTGAGGSESIPPDVLDEIRGIIAEWPMIEVRSGRDQGLEAHRRDVAKSAAKQTATAILRTAVFRLADHGVGGALPVFSDQATDGVLAYSTGCDRRAAARLAAGEHTFFHAAQLSWRTQIRGEKVHVYLDVSGSMENVIGPLYAALFPVLSWVEPSVHLFSTNVVDVDHARLRQRTCFTTGGTDIDVVTQHILKHKVQRAVIVTDGWVGQIPKGHLKELATRKVKLHAVLTKPGDAGFCKPAHIPFTYLPPL